MCSFYMSTRCWFQVNKINNFAFQSIHFKLSKLLRQLLVPTFPQFLIFFPFSICFLATFCSNLFPLLKSYWLHFRVPLKHGFNNFGSTIRTKTAIAQRKLLNATHKREANMAVVLVSTVIMFVICHMPRMLFVM